MALLCVCVCVCGGGGGGGGGGGNFAGVPVWVAFKDNVICL